MPESRLRINLAGVAKMANALDSNSGVERLAGSTPVTSINRGSLVVTKNCDDSLRSLKPAPQVPYGPGRKIGTLKPIQVLVEVAVD